MTPGGDPGWKFPHRVLGCVREAQKIDAVELEDIVFWEDRVDDMEPEDFFKSFELLKAHQPMVYATLGVMKDAIGDQRAYIGFLRFLYIIWQCLETTDARVATQKLTIDDLKRHITDRTQLLIYLGQEKEVSDFDAVMNSRVRDERQASLLSYICGGVMTETEIFPVKQVVKWQIVAWFWAVIDTFDEQMP